MNRISELIDALSEEERTQRRHIARNTHTCKLCGHPADDFRSPFSALEYTLSSICQACQDYYFLNDGQTGRR